MTNKIILQSIALDLKRAAIGYHSGSNKMADRFIVEIQKRKAMLDTTTLTETILKLVEKTNSIEKEPNMKKRAEQTLLLSNLFLSFSK